ncbi:MAG: ABC transporter permease [Gemmataceae bacterium]|nr:ABC transporter permease [Gemmataceae bacterium]
MGKYWNIGKLALKERLVYRGDFFLSTVLRFLPMVTSILLWKAVFGSASQDQLSGFSLNQVIAYLLLVHVSRMFSSMPGLAVNLARDIREGTIKKFLIQPLDLCTFLLSSRVAHKIAYISTSLIPYAGLFLACLSFFDTFPSGLGWVYYFISLALGFLVGFYFELCIGMIGFWFLEVTSLLYVVTTLSFFLSGHLIPLDFLDQTGWVEALKALPFSYMAYFPAALFLGKVPEGEIVGRLLLGIFWAIFFWGLSRVILHLGLKQYSAFGA